MKYLLCGLLSCASLFAQASASGRAAGTGTQLFITNPQTSTYQTIQTDWQFSKVITVASGTFTITLSASTAQPPSGQSIRIVNYGSGVVTVAPSGQNINGSSSNWLLPAGTAASPTGALITSDGTNYFAQDLGEGTATISTSGGTSGWSGLPLTFVTNATQYAPPVGGALTSTTEATVQLKASSTATLSGLQVTVSAALGVAATLAVTLRDGGVSQALTCTTASGGTTCTDTTHTVSVLQGDLLDFLLVSSGTVTAGLPQIEIGYAVATTSGGGTIAAPPYLNAGGNFYITADNMYLATLPIVSGLGPSGVGSWTVLGTLTPTIATSTNGAVNITQTSATGSFISAPTQTTSIEAVMNLTPNSASASAGIYFCDATNSRFYVLTLILGAGVVGLDEITYTFNCATPSGNPASASVQQSLAPGAGPYHFRGSVSGGTLTFSVSHDGGATFQALPTTYSVGTINKIGLTTVAGFVTLYSVVVN